MAKLKEGSVVEAIFAMYVACVLIDPGHGKKRTREIESAIKGMRLNTVLGNLITKETSGPRKGLFKQSVEFKATYPQDNPQIGGLLGAKVVSGSEGRKQVRPQSRLKMGKGYLKGRLHANRKYIMTDNFNVNNRLNYPDFSEVFLDVKVKEAETGGQMGKNLARLMEGIAADHSRWDTEKKQFDKYDSLKKKAFQLIGQSQGTSFYAKLIRAKELYLKNNRSDFIRYEVIADGISGEATGGKVKQDVVMDVIANGKRILHERLNFSMKSDVKTFNNAGLYNGIQDLYKFFGDSINPSEKIGAKNLKNTIVRDGQSKMNMKDIVSLYTMIVYGVRDNSKEDISKSDMWWDIFKKQVFGIGYTGSIQIVDIRRETIKELTPEYVDLLIEKNVKLYPLYKGTTKDAKSPGSIVFCPIYKTKTGVRYVEKDPTKNIFEWRFRYKNIKGTGSSKPEKLMSDLGGSRSIIHQSNYDKANIL